MYLAPRRHALAQIDGAAIFDPAGVLRHLGARLIPSSEAERPVDGFKGTRHTSGLRYSNDDPAATVIAISEDGPVSVFPPTDSSMRPGRVRSARSAMRSSKR